MSLYDAVDHFTKALDLLGGERLATSADPEKGHIYLGFLNLAKGLRHLETQIELLDRKINEVDSHVKRISR